MKTTNWLLNRQVLCALLAAPMLLSATAFADEAAPAAAVEASAPAPEAAKEPASPWTLSANINFTSDYYARGVSQSWHQPAVQGGFDVSHSSGFYAGVWGSSVSERTYVGGNTEFDFYGGYNGTIGAVEGLGYGVGVIGYYYPGGGWDDYEALTGAVGNNKGIGVRENADFNTWEANFGLSYKWVSAKVSYTLTDWYGASKDTGWSESTDGSLYYELNALVPLPVWGLNLIAHVGRLDVKGKLSDDPRFEGATAALDPVTGRLDILGDRSADMTDWKIGLSKAFEIAGVSGYNASLVYVGGSNGGNSGYWGTRGYGGSSFTTTTGSKDLTDDRVVLTVGRSF
jgi:uncharacterized protein (TIGR02001 family)